MSVIQWIDMGIPNKALRHSQLNYLNEGSPLADSSHQTFRVTFIEDSVLKNAFYKKIEPKNHYPELLAKISVAVSSFKRSFQGARSAEERLVFDDHDKLIGTLSINVDHFKPFNFASEPVPTDNNVQEQVIPSVNTLIEKNIMEILLGRWFLDDDDAHPHNLSLAGDIDFDMFLYWFTIHMKAARPIIGVPKRRISLSVGDYEAFPNVQESKPYHWPPYAHPGKVTLPNLMPIVQEQILPKILPKAYAAPEQFELLAHEPVAQAQKLAAALKILLSFQPEVQRRRLTAHFGDLTLNYTSLDETDVALRAKYEELYPELCNEKTNVKSFVDFMMTLYQEHYDNLYRVVIFYMGCIDNGYGVPQQPTYFNLYQKPSLYQNIKAWVIKENETHYAMSEVGLKYDLPELQKRYHQVWRDAFAPTLKELLHSSYKLTNELLKDVTTLPHMQTIEIISKKPTDHSITTAWELFGTMPELSLDIIESKISVDKDSKLREALLSLVVFTKQFHDITKEYYEKERQNMTEDDNLCFAIKLSTLYQTYNLKIRQHLANTTSQASEFNRIASNLKLVAEQVNFQLHLTTTDEFMSQAFVSIKKDPLPFTHKEVKKQYNDSLFVWVKSLKSEQFERYIIGIIHEKYPPLLTPFSMRHRAIPVKEYLNASKQESNDNRLAYILSSGTEDGALNTLIIKELTPLMLQTHSIPSIDNAIKDKSFEEGIADFTKDVVTFAKQDPRFIHLYSNRGITLFYKAIYSWVDSLTKNSFTGIIKAALNNYEKTLWGWSSRRTEVTGYMQGNENAKILALIFTKGSDTSTLSECLLIKIIELIKDQLAKNPEMRSNQAYKLIEQFNVETHKSFYLTHLKRHPETLAALEHPVQNRTAAPNL